MSVKAIYVPPKGGLDRLSVETCEVPAPGPGEISVRVRASSLNFHDYGVASGMMGPSEKRIPMSDGAGEVTAVGEGVTEFKVGDQVVSIFFPDWQNGEFKQEGFGRVPGDGIDGFAREEVTMPATAFTHIPKGYSYAEAATLTTAGVTAWRALMVDGDLKPGETVLVQGSGGVAIFALQFARMAGAEVIATSSSDDKLGRLEELGATHLINYRKDPEWGKTVRKLTDGRGVDHVIEVGGPDTLLQSMIATRIGGHIAMIGVLSGVDAALPVPLALGRQLRIQGLIVGSREHQKAMIRAIEANEMHPVIDRHFPLEQIGDAFRFQESKQHFGKICLDI